MQAYLGTLPMASYGAIADAHKALGANSHMVIVADKTEMRDLSEFSCKDVMTLSGQAE